MAFPIRFSSALVVVCLATLALTVPARAADPDDWVVKPDPVAEPIKGPFDVKGSIALQFLGKLAYPSRPSPFIAGTPSGAKDEIDVYDLRTMKPFGKPLTGKFDHDALVLSPDGAYLAGLVRDKNLPHLPVVEIWSVADGKSLRTIQLDDKRMGVDLLDFAGKGRLVTEKATSPDPTYQVWDIETGKEVLNFTYRLEFHKKWGAISPGGKYLVMEETGTTIGYHLVWFDLTTGKQVASVELQGPKDQWGQASAVAFSPDGEELAMLWRLNNKDVWGRMFVWDVKTGKKTLNLALPKMLPNQESLWYHGGARSFQWLPDRSGWLLFGHLIIDHDTGALVGKVPPEPDPIGTIERRALDRDHVATEGGSGPFDKKIVIATLPRDDIDAAVKKAHDATKDAPK